GVCGQKRPLAVRVGGEQNNRLSVAHAELERVQDLGATVPGLEVLNFQHELSLVSGAGPCAPPVPRYHDTTRSSLSTSAGGPSAIFAPWSSTSTRLDSACTAFMTCSIRSTVTPLRLILRTRSIISSRSTRLSPPTGSSSSSSLARPASAVATLRRFRWKTESAEAPAPCFPRSPPQP